MDLETFGLIKQQNASTNEGLQTHRGWATLPRVHSQQELTLCVRLTALRQCFCYVIDLLKLVSEVLVPCVLGNQGTQKSRQLVTQIANVPP